MSPQIESKSLEVSRDVEPRATQAMVVVSEMVGSTLDDSLTLLSPFYSVPWSS